MSRLVGYYHKHPDWQGVEGFLAGAESALPPEPRLALSLQDLKTGAVYNPHPNVQSEPVDSVPVIIEGQIRGLLNIARITSLSGRQQGYMLNLMSNFLLLVAVIGSLVGIPFGILFARSLTAPLERL